MKRSHRILTVYPDYDKACRLKECPPGLFLFRDALGFRSEYGDDAPYCCDSGEMFWGGECTKERRDELIVIPCTTAWGMI